MDSEKYLSLVNVRTEISSPISETTYLRLAILELMGNNSEERTLPEEIGMNMITSSLIGMVATTIIYMIMLFFIASASLRSESLALKILVSILLTTIIPAVLYKYGRKVIAELTDDLLINGMAVRGRADRAVVLSSLILALIGGGLFLFSPLLLQPAPKLQPIYVIKSDGSTFINWIESLYVDSISVFGFGVLAGSLTIGWYRFTYPMRCQNCGKRNSVEENYCHNCDAPSYVSSRSENLKNFLLDRGVRSYSGIQSEEED